MRRSWLGVLFGTLCVTGALLYAGRAPSQEPEPRAVLDALFGSRRMHLALADLVKQLELDPTREIQATELHRDAEVSHHLVAVRTAESPHRHDQSALVVVILEGGGVVRIGDEERAAPAGSILYVPRKTVHAFRNTADTPSIAYVVFAPPQVPGDRPAADTAPD